MFVWVVTYFDDNYNETEIIGAYSSFYKAYKAVIIDCLLTGDKSLLPRNTFWNDFDAKQYWLEIDEGLVRYEIQRTKLDEE